ncbi:MAG: nitroreductase family protein, partial [Acutalibacteraceae bacterium]|nr:nitroreductase family protein [Acutalibacteraceae bacterium]
MDTLRALELRHSVRSYTDQPLSGDVLTTLQKLVKEANKEGGLHIQLVLDRPKAFRGLLAKIGGFKNTKNYFAMIAKKNKG